GSVGFQMLENLGDSIGRFDGSAVNKNGSITPERHLGRTNKTWRGTTFRNIHVLSRFSTNNDVGATVPNDRRVRTQRHPVHQCQCSAAHRNRRKAIRCAEIDSENRFSHSFTSLITASADFVRRSAVPGAGGSISSASMASSSKGARRSPSRTFCSAFVSVRS